MPGLRREEVAAATGISVEYYARIERGDLRGVSTEVLDAIASALQLSTDEHAHLMHLAKPTPQRRRAGSPPRTTADARPPAPRRR